MNLSVTVDTALASARLWTLMLRIRDPAKLYKFWGVRPKRRPRGNCALP
jgi:hypothetical protein